MSATKEILERRLSADVDALGAEIERLEKQNAVLLAALAKIEVLASADGDHAWVIARDAIAAAKRVQS